MVTYDITKCCLCDACLKACPNGSSPRTRSMTPEQVMKEVKKNMPFIRGITVSGGECTRWRNFLAELFALAKEEGLHTLIDSNGSYDLSADPELMAVTDGVMLDVKAWDLTVHQGLCGAENSEVKANLDFLARCGKLTEVRTVVVPGLGDPEGTADHISKFIHIFYNEIMLCDRCRAGTIQEHRPANGRAAGRAGGAGPQLWPDRCGGHLNPFALTV